MTSYSIESSQRVAFDSPDHLTPRGTALDNSRNIIFNHRIFQLFNRGPLHVLDLGCSGGGFVKSVLDSGHNAAGLEGSDYSLKQLRAEWGTIGNHLFTCDITKPFQLRVQKAGAETIQAATFEVITAWEVIEHIAEKDLPQLCQNVLRHLAPGGLFIISVSPNEEIIQNVRYHQSVHGAEWWEMILRENGLENQPHLLHYFDHDWVRGPEQYAPGSFHFLLGRKGDTFPVPPVDFRMPFETFQEAILDCWRQQYVDYAVRLLGRHREHYLQNEGFYRLYTATVLLKCYRINPDPTYLDMLRGLGVSISAA